MRLSSDHYEAVPCHLLSLCGMPHPQQQCFSHRASQRAFVTNHARRHTIASTGPPPWGEGLALLRVCRALALRPHPAAEPLAALLQLVAAR